MKIYTRDDALHVDFEGMERVWALKRSLVIPFGNISSLEFFEMWERPASGAWLRIGGSFVPRVLMAGRYRNSGANYFVYIRGAKGTGFGSFSAENVAVITTREYPFAQIYLSVENPADLPQI